MTYKKRLCEDRVRQLSKFFKIVLLVGARQVGKSSLFAHLFPELRNFIFDPLQDLYGVRQDPDLFLKTNPMPIILDEIQYVPELLPSLKRKVDQSNKQGQYLLTGSQQLSVIKSITESLAGRVGIVELGVMTPQELYGSAEQNHWLSQYLSDPYNFQKNFRGLLPNTPYLFEALWRGSMPGTIELPSTVLPNYFSSYVQTYVERDVRTLDNIQDVALFTRFFALLGALTAQEINYAQLGREIGISPSTAQRWCDILRRTYQWYEVPAYHGNAIKRISSKPKGFFSDTGIACYMHRISSPESLAGHPFLGAMFETFCFSMIRGLSNSLDTPPLCYHWRTANGAEVDIILELNGKLYPIEIKCKSNVTRSDIHGMKAFRETYPQKNIMPGLVIYAGDTCYFVDENTIALPWNSI